MQPHPTHRRRLLVSISILQFSEQLPFQMSPRCFFDRAPLS
jgi:hypothetical protein